MGLFTKKQQIQEWNYLDLTPIANYEYNSKDGGLVDVLVPRFNDKFFGKILQPRIKNKYIKANLDKFGSETWKLINGKNKVKDIALHLENTFGDEVHPVNDRLTLFLTQLNANGFIYFLEFKKGR